MDEEKRTAPRHTINLAELSSDEAPVPIKCRNRNHKMRAILVLGKRVLEECARCGKWVFGKRNGSR